MRKSKLILFGIIFGLSAYAQPDQPTDPAPISDSFFVLIIAGLMLGIYVILRRYKSIAKL